MSQITTQAVDLQTVKAWQAVGRPLQLIDVRSASEYASGHLPEAINIPLEQIELRISDLNTSHPVVLVCQAGTRARMAAELLKNTNLDLLVLDGGTSLWQSSGNPIVRCMASRWALERQVRLIAGVLVAAGVALGVRVSPWWLIVPAFVGCGLTFAGITNFCPMGEILARMPWNRIRKAYATAPDAPQAVSCACEWSKRD